MRLLSGGPQARVIPNRERVPVRYLIAIPEWRGGTDPLERVAGWAVWCGRTTYILTVAAEGNLCG